jgi:hypothetical protein
VSLNLIHRNQLQVHVPNSFKYAVQDGLVGKRAADRGGTIPLVGDGQVIKPLVPLLIQVPFEPDLVNLKVRFILSSVIGALLL